MKHRVLVVDDKDDSRFLISRLLIKMKVDFVEAANGDRALELLLEDEFTIVITDLAMPGKDGFDVIRIIRENPSMESVYILVVSALKADEQIFRAFAHGADDYFVKPIYPEPFYEKIRSIIKNYETMCSKVVPVDPKSRFSNVRMGFEIFIREVTERGLIICTNIVLNPGTVFVPESEIFYLIGIRPPRLIVESCELRTDARNFTYSVMTRYEELSDEEFHKVRKWLLMQHVSTPETAS